MLPQCQLVPCLLIFSKSTFHDKLTENRGCSLIQLVKVNQPETKPMNAIIRIYLQRTFIQESGNLLKSHQRTIVWLYEYMKSFNSFDWYWLHERVKITCARSWKRQKIDVESFPSIQQMLLKNLLSRRISFCARVWQKAESFVSDLILRSRCDKLEIYHRKSSRKEKSFFFHLCEGKREIKKLKLITMSSSFESFFNWHWCDNNQPSVVIQIMTFPFVRFDSFLSSLRKEGGKVDKRRRQMMTEKGYTVQLLGM